MNKIVIVGRLTRDPEIRYGNNNKCIARIDVAVQRKYKNAQGQYESDFIPCVAFDKNAEFLEKYFKKGDSVGIIGHMTSGSYVNKNGEKVYTLDCNIDEIEFVGNKNSSSNNSAPANNNQYNNSGFSNIPSGIDMDLPFN